ncbi:MAG: hypothetical protein LBQ24_07625 [Candidatus Peribacteria bacterium]|nr:hypothetical protein [Candidatus Peribacteria bacterium]
MALYTLKLSFQNCFTFTQASFNFSIKIYKSSILASIISIYSFDAKAQIII